MKTVREVLGSVMGFSPHSSDVRRAEQALRELDAMEARVSKLEAALKGLRDDVTGALKEAERQANGASGMSVPYTGPFASGLRLPSVVRDLREQRRILDAALEEK